MAGNKTFPVAVLSAMIVLMMTGCSVQSYTELDASGSTEEGINAVVDANTKFALDFYALQSAKEGNIFFSPYSISTAFAMVYEGARGNTASEMKEVFGYPEESVMRPNIARIHNSLNTRQKDYQLSTANGVWAQEGYPFLPEYLDVIAKRYGGEIAAANFESNPEAERQRINSWVADKTRDKIEVLFPENSITPDTAMVLANAVYFKGSWLYEFDKSDTMDNIFYITPEKEVIVKMMSLINKEAQFRYYGNEELQAIELPYKGDDLSMLILLPRENSIQALEEKLGPGMLGAVQASMQSRNLRVFLPKFKFDAKLNLVESMKALGMQDAFNDTSADFSGMDGQNFLYIGKAFHQAFVDVNEEGTEAAAATGIVMELRATAVDLDDTFRADHPFIFFIKDNETGEILFMDRVMNPLEG